MMRMWIPNHLCIGESIYYFVLNQFIKRSLKLGEIKGHYLNGTSGTCKEMIKRAVVAKQIKNEIKY